MVARDLSPKTNPHGKAVGELATERIAGQGQGIGWMAFGWAGKDSFRVALGRAASKGPVVLKNVTGSLSLCEKVPDGSLDSSNISAVPAPDLGEQLPKPV